MLRRISFLMTIFSWSIRMRYQLRKWLMISSAKTLTEKMHWNFSRIQKIFRKYKSPWSRQLMEEYWMAIRGFAASENSMLKTWKKRHLQTAFVAFLPDNGTARMKETSKQHFETKLAAVPFDWIQSDYGHRRKKGTTAAKIGKTLGLSEKQVNLDIQISNLASEFLEYSGQNNFWHSLKRWISNRPSKRWQNNITNWKQNQTVISWRLCVLRSSLKWENPGLLEKKCPPTDRRSAKNLDAFEPEGETEENIPDTIFVRTKKKTTKKKKAEVVDLSSIDSATLAKKAADTETIRKAKHQASLDENFAVRQMKVCKTTLENIVEKWDKQKTEGLEMLVMRHWNTSTSSNKEHSQVILCPIFSLSITMKKMARYYFSLQWRPMKLFMRFNCYRQWKRDWNSTQQWHLYFCAAFHRILFSDSRDIAYCNSATFWRRYRYYQQNQRNCWNWGYCETPTYEEDITSKLLEVGWNTIKRPISEFQMRNFLKPCAIMRLFSPYLVQGRLLF